MHVANRPFEEEERVMVDKGSRASINSIESCDVSALGSVEELEIYCVNNVLYGCNSDSGLNVRLTLETYIASFEIETGGIELVCLRKIGHHHSVMAKFVDRRWACEKKVVSRLVELCLWQTHASQVVGTCLLV